MGRNVSERSANFDHGSLLATQLGGFRFISNRSGNDMLGHPRGPDASCSDRQHLLLVSRHHFPNVILAEANDVLSQ